ncbi:MAG TPA: CHASE3 domain-containing protein, partial [Bryobacteraceae bacterium]|nr:CHASE3 domain-containing protein [Bryobacteraceae bacterium]
MHAAQSRALGVAAIATALLTLLVISVLCYQDWKHYEAAYTRIRETRRILNLNEALIDGVRDAETSQRGFLLTGRPEYLEPYRAALDHLPAETSELASLSQDPDRRARSLQLQSLIATKLDELRTTIELRQSGQAAAALAFVQSGQGQRTMEQIRQISQQMEEAETARWQGA